MLKTSFFGFLTVGNLHRKDLAWKKELLQRRPHDESCHIVVKDKKEDQESRPNDEE
ncbi:MAG: hypothetical protein LBE67_07870 [Kocuria palustris]|jgi:hypothetical protein|nr:hypothetical protein [Kocuria palustris]